MSNYLFVLNVKIINLIDDKRDLVVKSKNVFLIRCTHNQSD